MVCYMDREGLGKYQTCFIFHQLSSTGRELTTNPNRPCKHWPRPSLVTDIPAPVENLYNNGL